MDFEEANKRREQIRETIKELRAYSSDKARAQRTIVREKAILEGVSRRRDPVPWAVAQFKLASALSVTAVQASDISGLRRAALRLDKAWRIFRRAGYDDAVQRCEMLLAAIKKQLAKLGDEGDLFDPKRDMGGDDGEPDKVRDLADQLRQASRHIDRDAAMRRMEAFREARIREEMAVRDAALAQEREREQARRRERDDDRGWDR